jgi:hypothetical protein
VEELMIWRSQKKIGGEVLMFLFVELGNGRALFQGDDYSLIFVISADVMIVKVFRTDTR